MLRCLKAKILSLTLVLVQVVSEPTIIAGKMVLSSPNAAASNPCELVKIRSKACASQKSRKPDRHLVSTPTLLRDNGAGTVKHRNQVAMIVMVVIHHRMETLMTTSPKEASKSQMVSPSWRRCLVSWQCLIGPTGHWLSGQLVMVWEHHLVDLFIITSHLLLSGTSLKSFMAKDLGIFGSRFHSDMHLLDQSSLVWPWLLHQSQFLVFWPHGDSSSGPKLIIWTTQNNVPGRFVK